MPLPRQSVEATTAETDISGVLSYRCQNGHVFLAHGTAAESRYSAHTFHILVPSMQTRKKVLLVDLDDTRRETRVKLLDTAGYEVDVRVDHVTAERLDRETGYDLIIVALHNRPEDAAAYTDRLTRRTPTLPILLLTDRGVYVPRGTLSQSIGAGDPHSLNAPGCRNYCGKQTRKGTTLPVRR
jgi:hypothetical protein